MKTPEDITDELRRKDNDDRRSLWGFYAVAAAYSGPSVMSRAADEIDRLRNDCIRYRTSYLRALVRQYAAPGRKWRTYANPQRSDGLFVATDGCLEHPQQAVPYGAIGPHFQLAHKDAEELADMLNLYSRWLEDDDGQ